MALVRVIIISTEGKGRRRSRVEWHGLVVRGVKMMIKSSSRRGRGGEERGAREKGKGKDKETTRAGGGQGGTTTTTDDNDPASV